MYGAIQARFSQFIQYITHDSKWLSVWCYVEKNWYDLEKIYKFEKKTFDKERTLNSFSWVSFLLGRKKFLNSNRKFRYLLIERDFFMLKYLSLGSCLFWNYYQNIKSCFALVRQTDAKRMAWSSCEKKMKPRISYEFKNQNPKRAFSRQTRHD